MQDSLDQTDSQDGQFFHWADSVADQIIRIKTKADGSAKDVYTCASGITPSGTVHIGNFREIISVELVVRALRERGKNVRFIYSWDDYDVFRKVPKNMPQAEMLFKHLRWPITMVPDPWEKCESYARHHELAVEAILPSAGMSPEYLYQATKYRRSEYAANIRLALQKKDQIKAVLDEFRTEDLEGDWWPVSVFSSFTNKDTTTILSWDGDWGLTYRCDETGNTETIDLRTTAVAKLPWRIDWPMRWSVEGVDFEPAGKDHHSDGGSWSTAERICEVVFGIKAPVTFKYDFVRTKGRAGKMSSSTGEVISLSDVLEIYTPELTRYLFAGTRPNTEFAISFDLDVIKIYEDYDRTERICYGREAVEASHAETVAKTIGKEKRIYILSQLQEMPAAMLPFMPLQIPFRTMCNLLLINNGDINKALRCFPAFTEAEARGELNEATAAGAENLRRLRSRAQCAWKWLQDFAPEDMKFFVRPVGSAILTGLTEAELACIREVVNMVASKTGEWGDGAALESREDKVLQDIVYQIARRHSVEPKALFTLLYRILIDKLQGPRIGSFLKTLGAEHVVAMLQAY